jgi:hypothetical protein
MSFRDLERVAREPQRTAAAKPDRLSSSASPDKAEAKPAVLPADPEERPSPKGLDRAV